VGNIGSRTRSTDTWLLPSDESRFGEAITSVFADSGWRCSHPGPSAAHPRHVHPTVAQAMDCGGGVQAFLPLPVGVDPFGADGVAEVQLLRSTIREDELTDRYFRCGRLATRWSEPDVGPRLHAVLSAQCDEIWRVLRRSTSPAHIEDLGGRRVSAKRIGPDALAMVTAKGLPLAPAGGFTRYKLR
jgi:hypothetical protein